MGERVRLSIAHTWNGPERVRGIAVYAADNYGDEPVILLADEARALIAELEALAACLEVGETTDD